MHNIEFQQRTIDSIFLEILDDLSKKEVLLMILCYMQLVRKENSFEVPLYDLIKCSDKPHKNLKGDWRDIMMELGLFYITEDNKIYEGKDIFKTQNIYQATVSISNTYKANFSEISVLITKYWNIVSKLASFNEETIAKRVTTTILLFNEKLYKECILYSNMLKERVISEKEQTFFEAIIYASFAMEFYKENLQDKAKEYSKKAIEKINGLECFYNINLKDFSKSLDIFFKKSPKTRKEPPKLTIMHYQKNSRFLSKLLNKIKQIFRFHS